MVRKVSILCMVASLLFSLKAATPLVTQYIAPVDNPSWDNAVTNGYSNGIDYRPHKVDEYYNYSIFIGGTLYVTWNSYVEFSSIYAASYTNIWRRSVLSPPTSPSKRYLYLWTDVYTNTKKIVSNTTVFPNDTVVVSAGLDTDKAKAEYVQCVHTDWVYKVTFDANGGGGSMGKFVFTNSAALPANAFSRTGYGFSKWENNGTGVSYRDKAEVKTDLDLSAIWAANTYTITFSGEGATTAGKRSCTVKYDGSLSDMLQPDLPKRTGYEFGGYFSDPEGKGKQWYSSTGEADDETWNVASNTTLYAKWTGVPYYVSYVKGAVDVTGSMDRQAFIYGESQALLVNKYEREGYTFIGWATHENASIAYTDCEVVSNLATEDKAEVYLYAIWEKVKPPETVAVVFDANGGVFDAEAATYERNIILGGRFESLPMPTNANNSLLFAGWWTSTNPVDRVQILSTNIVDAAITNLYARWKAVVSADMCILTFYLADGKPSTNVTAVVGDEFGRWFLDPAPQYTGGYRHFGWYRANGSRVEETDIIEDDTKLTGRWTLGAFNDAWNCANIAFSTNSAYGWKVDELTGIAQNVELPSDENAHNAELSLEADSDGDISFDWSVSYIDESEEEDPDSFRIQLLFSTNEGDSLDYLKGQKTEDSSSWQRSWTNVSHPLSGRKKKKYNLAYQRNAWVSYENIPDCGWVKDMQFTPVAVSTPLDDWTSFISVTSSVRRAVWTAGGAAQWATVVANKDWAAAGRFIDGRSSWVRLDVPPAKGVLEFKWRTSCEDGYVDTNGVYRVCDRLEFQDERGERTLRIEGVMSDWESVVWTNSVESAHTFTWRYVKDGDTSAGDDAAWIKDVKWTPFPPEPKPFRVLIW